MRRTALLLALLACTTIALAVAAPVASSQPGGYCGLWPPGGHSRYDVHCRDYWTGEYCLLWSTQPDNCWKTL